MIPNVMMLASSQKPKRELRFHNFFVCVIFLWTEIRNMAHQSKFMVHSLSRALGIWPTNTDKFETTALCIAYATENHTKCSRTVAEPGGLGGLPPRGLVLLVILKIPMDLPFRGP